MIFGAMALEHWIDLERRVWPDPINHLSAALDYYQRLLIINPPVEELWWPIGFDR